MYMMLVTVLVLSVCVSGLAAIEEEDCAGMSKAMRRMKCKKVSKNELPDDWDISGIA